MKWILTALLLFGLSHNSFSCSPDGSTGFMPENDMNIPVGHRSAGEMTEAEFNQIIDEVEDHYAPIIKDMGARLKIKRKWKSGTVNAFAQQSWWFGKIYKVTMYGGLARHPEINNDGFALVVCHELGHHIGGEPKKGGMWASNEGQSDYFASLKCFRAVYENDNNIEIVSKMNIDPIARSACEAQWSGANDQALCMRAAMGGYHLSRVLGGAKTGVAFDTPSKSVVSTTFHAHPQAQCRLDTYYQGALCTIDHSIDVSNKSATQGMCNRMDGDTVGVRPFCWYKPETI